MFCSGVLEELEKEEYQDKFGNAMDKENTLGLSVKYKVKHPEYILFVDEVGNNTCMNDNGQVGGSFLVNGKEELVKIAASNGEPLLCALFFASETITAEEKLGFDVFVDVDGSLSDLPNNYVPSKAYPCSPKCKLKRKEVPAFILCTPKGCIFSELLCSMPQWIDLCNIYDQHPWWTNSLLTSVPWITT